uniref:K-box domain-containing protein n=1 Tax=Hyaloperonospora arabidopsidis (strain Emoy2) TaxID=559515 RepID=M4B355_HYAAE
MWVTTWTLYGFWHEANQIMRTLDPLLVVKDLPVEELEMQFRVRLKARPRPTSLLEQFCVFCCFLLPVDVCGSSEVVGDWSDVVTVSAAVDDPEDDQVEALVALFVGNPFMAVLVTLCIGSGCFVVVQLHVRRRRAGQRSSRWWNMQSCIWSSTGKNHEIDAEQKTSGEAALNDGRSEDCSKTVQQLEHEIRDLRQELADSEYEVRRLMLFRGYGIETLGRDELKQLEGELQHTLERIRELKKGQTCCARRCPAALGCDISSDPSSYLLRQQLRAQVPDAFKMYFVDARSRDPSCSYSTFVVGCRQYSHTKVLWELNLRTVAYCGTRGDQYDSAEYDVATSVAEDV